MTITLPLRSSPPRAAGATVRDATGAVLFTAAPQVCAQIAADMNAVDKLVDALRLIKNQITAPDWTAEQALDFIKGHAKETLASVARARQVAVNETIRANRAEAAGHTGSVANIYGRN